MTQQSNLYGKLPRLCSIIYFWFVKNTIAYHLRRYSFHLLLLKSSMLHLKNCPPLGKLGTNKKIRLTSLPFLLHFSFLIELTVYKLYFFSKVPTFSSLCIFSNRVNFHFELYFCLLLTTYIFNSILVF